MSDTTFVLKNTGDGMLQVTALSFRQGTYYQTLSPALPFQLSPGADSIVRTRYKPTTRGWHRDTLAIGSDGILSPRLVEFTGTDSIIIGVRESDSPREEIVVQNFPNPFSSKTIISFSGEAGLAGGTLEISDVLGRTLYSSLIEKGQRQLTIDASRLPAGMYMYSLKTERSIFGGMMTVVK